MLLCLVLTFILFVNVANKIFDIILLLKINKKYIGIYLVLLLFIYSFIFYTFEKLLKWQIHLVLTFIYLIFCFL